MKIILSAILGAGIAPLTALNACEVTVNSEPAFAKSPSLKIKSVRVEHHEAFGSLTFTMELEGPPGGVVPKAVGKLDGAPILAYVFPTTLKASDVGMGSAEGIVALAITSHPDFDDTPLWDENGNGDYGDDKQIYHTHWALLAKDARVAGGLAVREFKKEDKSVVLPPSNCGMPMYLDSPGHAVAVRGNMLRVVVPAFYARTQTKFRYDGVTCYMQVNTSCMQRPMLGVYEVYSVASKDLSLPYSTK